MNRKDIKEIREEINDVFVSLLNEIRTRVDKEENKIEFKNPVYLKELIGMTCLYASAVYHENDKESDDYGSYLVKTRTKFSYSEEMEESEDSVELNDLSLDELIYIADAVMEYEEEHEKKETKSMFEQAVDYVRENKTWSRHDAKKAWNEIFDWHVPLNDKIKDEIYDLMVEFGQDNDLPEDWWLDEGDEEDIFKKL